MNTTKASIIYILSSVIVFAAIFLFPTEKPARQLGYQYWQDVADLKGKAEEVLDNDSCYTSKKVFLSCINGVNRLLQSEFNQELDFEGNFITQRRKTNEKTKMKVWETQFGYKKIDFKDTLARAMKDVDDQERNYAYGQVINGFLSIYKDPHTYIMPTQLFNDTIDSNESKSLGFKISKKNDGSFFFRRISKGSLFDKYGVKSGDTLVRLEDLDLSKSTLTEIYFSLKNKKQFKFTVNRDEEKLDFAFNREEVLYSEVSADFYENYSVISVERFSKNTCEKVESFVNESKSKNINNIILDLRENGGGLMPTAECMANLFLKQNSLIYKTMAFKEEDNAESSSEEDPIYNGNLFVLVNGSSASSSELLAGTLQAHKRATIVGQTTYGKGSFQEGRTWEKGLIIFETKGLFMLPNGETPQFKGIIPDIAVKSYSSAEGRESNTHYSAINPEANDLFPTLSKQELKYNSQDNELSAVLDIIKSRSKQAEKPATDSF